jgi:4-hydroxy-tetrahydrodipicolinate synthase
MLKETMIKVAEINGVEYVKETSRNWNELGWLLERIYHASQADVFATMDVLLATFQTDVMEAVIPAPSTLPAMKINESFETSNLDAAIEAQRSFGTFSLDEVEAGSTAVCKAATELSGVDVGPPRAPYDAVFGSWKRVAAGVVGRARRPES